MRNAPLVALCMAAVALAGCSGSDALDIKFTPADDPVTQPTVFEATGAADRFVWDFNDGSGTHEGRRVEHTFGFTDGQVAVRLTAFKGDAPTVITKAVTLGSGQNQNPQPAMVGTTDWTTPGATVRLSGATSTDADGDPLLYRWTCRRAGDALPSHLHAHSGQGGVPFGVQVLGMESADVPAAERSVAGDLCENLADNTFSRQATVEGAFTATGVYDVDVAIRDPKSPAFVARMRIFVTDSMPPTTTTHTFSGALTVGSGGSLQDAMNEAGNPTGIVWDRVEEAFTVPLPNTAGTITFTATPQVPGVGTVTFEVKAAGAIIIAQTSAESVTLPKNALRNGLDYVVEFTLDDGALVDYTWTLETTNDMTPTHLWESSA
jgi:hypothetical protein